MDGAAERGFEKAFEFSQELPHLHRGALPFAAAGEKENLLDQFASVCSAGLHGIQNHLAFLAVVDRAEQTHSHEDG
jgi:hypothetical protein